MNLWIRFLRSVVFIVFLEFSTSVKWQQCASVTTDHADALETWLTAAISQVQSDGVLSIDTDIVSLRGLTSSTNISSNSSENIISNRLSVLHIDHHSDINVPQKYIPNGFKWLQNNTSLNLLTSTSDLASFQLSAVWGGLIDNIVWLKPFFHGDKKRKDDIFEETHLLYFNSTLGSFESEAFQNNSKDRISLNKRLDLFERLSIQSEEYRYNEIRIDSLMINSNALFDLTSSMKQKIRNNNILKLADFLGLDYKKANIGKDKIEIGNKFHMKKYSKQFILDIDLDYFVPVERYASTPPWANLPYSEKQQENPFGKLTIAKCRPEILKFCPNGSWADQSCPVWDVLLDIQSNLWYGTLNHYDKDSSVSSDCYRELNILVKIISSGRASKQLKCLRDVVTPAEWILWAKLLHDQPKSFHNLLATENGFDTNAKDSQGISIVSSDGMENSINRYMMIAAQGTNEMHFMVDQIGEVLSVLSAVPVVISIARSTDYWTPVSEYAAIEIAVLRMLRRVYGTKPEYLLHGNRIDPLHYTKKAVNANKLYSDRVKNKDKSIRLFNIGVERGNNYSADSMICTSNSMDATPSVDMLNGMYTCSSIENNMKHEKRVEL